MSVWRKFRLAEYFRCHWNLTWSTARSWIIRPAKMKTKFNIKNSSSRVSCNNDNDFNRIKEPVDSKEANEILDVRPIVEFIKYVNGWYTIYSVFS